MMRSINEIHREIDDLSENARGDIVHHGNHLHPLTIYGNLANSVSKTTICPLFSSTPPLEPKPNSSENELVIQKPYKPNKFQHFSFSPGLNHH